MTNIVYIGKRMVKGGKLGDGFIAEDKLTAYINGGGKIDGVDLIASIFAETKNKSWRIGGVYSGDVNLENDCIANFYPHKMEYVKLVEGEASWWISGWEQRNDMHKLRLRTDKAEKRFIESRNLDAHVTALQDVYKNLDIASRLPFLVWLQDQIRK